MCLNAFLFTSRILYPSEKTHVFRIEETFPSPASTAPKTTSTQRMPTKATNNSSVNTQTSPRGEVVPSANTPPSLSATPTVATPSPPVHLSAFATPQPFPQPQAFVVPQYVPQQSPVHFALPQVSHSNMSVSTSTYTYYCSMDILGHHLSLSTPPQWVM